MDSIKLTNVMDIRNGKIYSVVVVSERKAKYFVPIQGEEE